MSNLFKFRTKTKIALKTFDFSMNRILGLFFSGSSRTEFRWFIFVVMNIIKNEYKKKECYRFSRSGFARKYDNITLESNPIDAIFQSVFEAIKNKFSLFSAQSCLKMVQFINM